jgi:hypothetical protein
LAWRDKSDKRKLTHLSKNKINNHDQEKWKTEWDKDVISVTMVLSTHHRFGLEESLEERCALQEKN